MSAAHAPRPWVAASDPDDDQETQWGVKSGGYWIAMCLFSGSNAIGNGTAEGHARLMAAAPNLLQALERLSAAALARDNTMGDACSLLAAKAELADANRAACAVIAQARGQS